MRRRLLATFLVFAVVVVIGLEVPLGLALAGKERSTALSALQRNASSLGVLVTTALDHGGPAAAARVITAYAASEKAVVAVVSGRKVLAVAGTGASEEVDDPRTQAILGAAASGRETGIEGAKDSDDLFLYAAQPLAEPSASSGDAVLMLAIPAGPLNARIAADWWRLAIFGAIVLVIAAVVGTILSRSLTGTLTEIELAVACLGEGDLSVRAPVGPGPPELRTLAGTVNDMADRLQELMTAQRSFVADASHQLRTPLTALRLRLENLEGANGAPSPADLGAALDEVDRLSRLVDGLLALARTDGSRPERVDVDVRAVLRERLEVWQPLAEERGLTLSNGSRRDHTSDAAEPLHVLACEGHIEQILDNFLANALESTPPGGHVSAFVVRGSSDAELHVVDDGPGLRAEERERAFDRFWRADTAAKDGTGLGLAIVAQLARASGGTAWLAARRGGGLDAVARFEEC